jgi:hypothetical protein
MLNTFFRFLCGKITCGACSIIYSSLSAKVRIGIVGIGDGIFPDCPGRCKWPQGSSRRAHAKIAIPPLPRGRVQACGQRSRLAFTGIGPSLVVEDYADPTFRAAAVR